MTTFNLVDEPWIPVVIDGRRVDVSLLDALMRAHEIDSLALDDPLQTVALLRQALLPVVFDAFGLPNSPEEWARRWASTALDPARLSSYLSEHRERFDLFADDTPFAQVAGLRTIKDETKPVSLLLPAAATGNNVPLFSSRTEADPPTLTPAQATRALLAAHCWDTAAIKSGAVDDPLAKAGKTTGNPAGPLGQLGVIVPLGRTLAQTLMLNMPIIRQGLRHQDGPQWRAQIATAAWRSRPAEGLLDLLTWQSRRIRLVPEIGIDGHVVVRRVVLAAGERLDQLDPDVELHTAWRRRDKPQAGQPPVYPVRHQPGRAAWRGLEGLLAIRQPDGKLFASLLLAQIANLRAEDCLSPDFPLQVLTVGVSYGNQSAVIEDVMVDVIPLPVTAVAASGPVRQTLLEIVDQAEQMRNAANQLGDDLRRAVGGDRLPWDGGQRLGDTLIHQFTPVVHRLLAGLQRQPDRVEEASEAWRHVARQLARDAAEPALSAAPPQAFLGRQESERVTFRASVAEARYKAAIRRALGPPTAPVLPPAQSGVPK